MNYRGMPDPGIPSTGLRGDPTLDQKAWSYYELIGQKQKFPFTNLGLISIADPKYGAKLDGRTDDSSAIIAASKDGITQSTAVFFPGFAYVTTAIVLDSTYTNLKWYGMGKDVSGILKGFNGDLVTVSSCQNFEYSN